VIAPSHEYVEGDVADAVYRCWDMSEPVITVVEVTHESGGDHGAE